MLKNLSEVITLSKTYNIPTEDILFLDFSLSGVKLNCPYVRVRFKFIPENKLYFKISFQRNINEYFFALPTNPHSIYCIKNNHLIAKEEEIGEVECLANDTCDSSYPRRGGTVLNLNPIPKSLCHGCKFCHTILQDARDKKENLRDEISLRRFIKEWLKKQKKTDLSHLIQVAIVTGCFGDEEKLVEWLKMARKVLNEYKFNGELFYYGSEITKGGSLDEISSLKPFGLCISLECFEKRNLILRYTKRRLKIKDIKRILKEAMERGIRTNFSYILGIEPLEIINEGFKELKPYINSFPVINVFQLHQEQEDLRCKEALSINYYIKVRKMIEKIFEDKKITPRVWENYRSPWYLQFGRRVLDDIRVP